MTRRTLFPTLCLGAVTLAARAVTCQVPLVVHEWGTITTRHAPDGTPLGRLNHIGASDTLPAFVHRYEPAATANRPDRSLVKTAIVAGREDVTMRLETPVLYFHAPREAGPLPPFSVSVHFHGGIINEFYPDAEPSVAVDPERADRSWLARVLPTGWTGEHLDDAVVGRLVWRGVSLVDTVGVTPTRSQLWLAPRRVQASGVSTASGERERYLFYRGVAHLDALLQTQVTASEVRLRAPRDLRWMHAPTMTIASSWLVDIRPDGAVAFREHGPIPIERGGGSEELARLPLFAEQDYAAANLTGLRRGMKQALTARGLFDDEAEALLETWKASYFRTPGLRVFYMVPDEWLGTFLPVSISTRHELTRVLVGRIDLDRGARN